MAMKVIPRYKSKRLAVHKPTLRPTYQQENSNFFYRGGKAQSIKNSTSQFLSYCVRSGQKIKIKVVCTIFGKYALKGND